MQHRNQSQGGRRSTSSSQRGSQTAGQGRSRQSQSNYAMDDFENDRAYGSSSDYGSYGSRSQGMRGGRGYGQDQDYGRPDFGREDYSRNLSYGATDRDFNFNENEDADRYSSSRSGRGSNESRRRGSQGNTDRGYSQGGSRYDKMSNRDDWQDDSSDRMIRSVGGRSSQNESRGRQHESSWDLDHDDNDQNDQQDRDSERGSSRTNRWR